VLGGADAVLIATAEARDDEMAARIAAHRAERPATWRTVEEPLDLAAALRSEAAGAVVVDCLSLWVANALEAGRDVEADTAAAIGAARERPGRTIVVTNEVGMGIVPVHPVARSYRDVLGRVNARWSLAADRALLVVAGRTLPLDLTTSESCRCA